MDQKEKNDIEYKSFLGDILLTVFTFGLFNLWVQIRQLSDLNTILGEHKYSFTTVFLLTIFTFGLYFIYHEFKVTKELHLLTYGKRYHFMEFLMIPLTTFGLWFFVDSYQQELLNNYIEKNQSLN